MTNYPHTEAGALRAMILIARELVRDARTVLISSGLSGEAADVIEIDQWLARTTTEALNAFKVEGEPSPLTPENIPAPADSLVELVASVLHQRPHINSRDLYQAVFPCDPSQPDPDSMFDLGQAVSEAMAQNEIQRELAELPPPLPPTSSEVVDKPDDDRVDVVGVTVQIVREWIERTARRLRHDDMDFAELKLRAVDPGWDDDDTAMISIQIEESGTLDPIEGRVQGVK